MNKIILIGSLGRDPEMRTTPSGLSVCTFSVGVTDKHSSGQEKTTTWFRVTVWRQLAEICQKWLTKGKKVCVTGSVSVSTYEAKDGTTRASLEVTADDVEFLSAREDSESKASQQAQVPSGFTHVDDIDSELPF